MNTLALILVIAIPSLFLVSILAYMFYCVVKHEDTNESFEWNNSKIDFWVKCNDSRSHY